jgi:hypothetical protein
VLVLPAAPQQQQPGQIPSQHPQQQSGQQQQSAGVQLKAQYGDRLKISFQNATEG